MSLSVENYITIIYPPTANWHLMFQRPQQLFTAFSKLEGVRSIFVTLELYQQLDQPIVKLNDDLFLVREGVPYDHLVKGKKILWFSYPPQINLLDKENFDFVVFDAIDNPVDEFSYWKHYLEHAAKNSNLISCTAQIMYDYHCQFEKPIIMLPNGADYMHFNQAKDKLPCPKDLPSFKEKEVVIGFYGSMASWVDYHLIEKISEKYKVVLIGNHKYLNKNLNRPNITLIEHKQYEELPLYLAQFTLAIIPFRLTDMTKGCDPIKFYEYLSAGKPVLTTALPALEKYKALTYIIDEGNCHKIIEKALAEDNLERQKLRMLIGKENSWENRAKKAVRTIRSKINLSNNNQ